MVNSAHTAFLDSDARLFPSASPCVDRHAQIIDQAFNRRVWRDVSNGGLLLISQAIDEVEEGSQAS